MLLTILGCFFIASPFILFFFVAWKDGYLECAILSFSVMIVISVVIFVGLYLLSLGGVIHP